VSGEIISTKKPRRPLIVAGHCRRLFLLLRRSWWCCDGADAARSSRPSSRCRRVPPRGAVSSTSRRDVTMRRPVVC